MGHSIEELDIGLSCIVEEGTKTANSDNELGSALSVDCPTGYQRTGCTATCRGHWSNNGVSARDWDLSPNANGCTMDANTKCYGSDPLVTLKTICCKISGS